MTNKLTNATGLDGTAGYTGGGALSTNETTTGGPGRIVVLSASGHLATDSVPVSGAVIYAYAHHAPGSRVRVRFLDAALATVGADVLLPLVDPTRPDSPMTRGLPSTFDFSRGQAVRPTGATRALLRVEGGPNPKAILKPYLADDRMACWRPGPHGNPDLNLASWPDLPPPQAGGFQVAPTGMRQAYETDSRKPITRRLPGASWYVLRATVSLDQLQRDRLQQFYESAQEPFWYVRPDTHQVSRAWWLEDGDPTDDGLGRGRTTQYGLLLEPA